MRIDNQYTTMMTDIEKTDKMFGVVFSDGKGQFCEIGTPDSMSSFSLKNSSGSVCCKGRYNGSFLYDS